jgi:ElaB/YqjD/DUF883 family membrane-anchored ribosome-binding protein
MIMMPEERFMAQHDDELPEGTDHIINGAMETGGGFIGAAGGDGTGGTAIGGGGNMNERSGNPVGERGSAAGGGVVDQLREQASAIRDQAGDRVREFADSGKTRASDALDQLSRVVGETAETIDERLGDEYGEYARRAADAVSGFADSLRRQDVDELYENVRSAVRKSPAVAVGIAAIVGFTLVRLVKSGIEESRAEQGRSRKGSKRGERTEA